MELTLWTYEGPPHVGAMRIANSMRGLHYVLHSPQGDTYADLLFTMIERDDHRPPVTYTTFQSTDLGADTADLVRKAVYDAYQRFQPQAMLVGESCTAELIQDQPGSLAQGMDIPVPVVPLELPAYSRKENWGTSETFYQLVRAVLSQFAPPPGSEAPTIPTDRRPRANLLGPSSLGFRCRDDVTEVTKLLESVGVDVNVVAPLGAAPEDLARIPEGDFNCCLYPEVAQSVCKWIERTFRMPTVWTVPLGINNTRDFLDEIAGITGIDVSAVRNGDQSRLPWYSRSVDSTYLTGKRVFIFADATHAVAAARIASEELGYTVVGLGTYSRELARNVRSAAEHYGVEPLITDDYLEVEAKMAEAEPELILGTQMERHIAKKLGVACAVISTPAHVQDFPARYSPQMGFEGANVIFDDWVHPLMMGLEEHLLGMFREDFEFNDEAKPSHLATTGEAAEAEEAGAAVAESAEPAEASAGPTWDDAALTELNKIPFFVRGKARRNTERYARDQGITQITVETLYDAKAHYGRG